MKRYLNYFITLMLTLIIVLGLTGCGSSLQKPTGLESTGEQQDDAEEVFEQISEESKTKDESKEPKQDDAELGKEIVDSEEKNNESSAVETKKDETVPKTSADHAKKTEKPAPSKSAGTSKSSETSNQPDKTTSKSAEKPKEKPKEQPKEKPKEQPKEKPKPVKDTIVHSIVISSSEVPLPPTEMEIQKGDTVLQALISITMEKAIQMDYRGGQGASAYVQGLDNVYEFDRGQGSGWMYRVNGIFPDRGAGVVPLLDGDRVEWLYTTNLGEDLGADLQPFRR